MRNLEAFGVSKLSIHESKKTCGGWWQYAAGAVAYFLYESAANPKASADAFMKGFDAAMKK